MRTSRHNVVANLTDKIRSIFGKNISLIVSKTNIRGSVYMSYKCIADSLLWTYCIYFANKIKEKQIVAALTTNLKVMCSSAIVGNNFIILYYFPFHTLLAGPGRLSPYKSITFIRGPCNKVHRDNDRLKEK